ncbi:MAG TPA: SLBB domain-containing protein [Syntrophales bacterium]|nr:SLBB domain-containing protein [Syntrophales bacterium]
MKRKIRNLTLSLAAFLAACLVVAAPPLQAQGASPGVTVQSVLGPEAVRQTAPLPLDVCRKLPPDQRAACEAELQKTGGWITPEALEAIKARPEYKGLSPEEMARGRQLLEQREKTFGKGEPEKPTQAASEKRTLIEEPRERSLFDRARKIGNYQDISVDLKPFGYDFFGDASIRVLTDRRDIPVPLKYVIGPGDEVKLLLWGRINAQYNLTVDRDGKITIPQIGPLFVAGMTFEEMSKQVVKQSEQVVGTNVDISMGSLKTIPIFVLGDVRRPGSYTIGSFATITDALLLAGGPTEIGSMRSVQLKRKGQLVTAFDLYDLLLKGDKSRDVTLMAGDVVFVPVTGPLVGIAGNVRRPAIYELKDRYDLEYIFELAGGIIPTADTQQIQVERIVKNERQVVLDINDRRLETAARIGLQDADLVKIFSIVDTNVNAVYLNGNVKRPGKYEMKPGMRLSDLVKSPEDLLKETYLDYALIKRLKLPERQTVLIPVNLGSVLFGKDPANDVELTREDQVFVFSRWFFNDKPVVSIEGEIRGDCNAEQGARPERTQVDAAAVAAEIKAMEEELRKEGAYSMANALREIGVGIRTEGRAPADALRILREDLIRSGRPGPAERLRDIENKTKAACTISLAGNMRVKDAILSAGGLTNDSYLEKGEIVRTSRQREYRTFYFDVARAMADDPAHNLALEDQDRIVIHSVWEQTYKKQVSIDGDVAKPGSYQYTDGMTVRDLVFKGGNILESAYVEEAEISSIVIEKGRKTSKTERRVINLRKALEGDPAENVVLSPYDRLFVKRIPEWGAMKFVTVSGELRFPGRYAVHKGEKLSSLIERAGGYMPAAYLRGAVFTRQSVRELQQQGLEEMTRRLERELLVQGSSSVSTALSAEEIKAKEVEMVQKQKFVETLKGLKAQGRMAIRLANLRLLKASEYDIELEDGDRLHIPQRQNVVNVMGAVMAQASYVYLDRFTYKDYIGMAGGYARYADEDSTFVLKADGSARRLSRGFVNWNDSRSRWELAAFGEEVKDIEPGDVIVVPEEFGRIAWLREIRDITQIIMNTAVVAAVILKLY